MSVLDVFDRLACDGVELRILHASLPSRAFRSAFDERPRLVAGGLRLRQCPRVHLKVVVIDGALLYLGSANWTGAGLGATAIGDRAPRDRHANSEGQDSERAGSRTCRPASSSRAFTAFSRSFGCD